MCTEQVDKAELDEAAKQEALEKLQAIQQHVRGVVHFYQHVITVSTAIGITHFVVLSQVQSLMSRITT